MKKPKTGSREWRAALLWRNWQIIRRHPDYVAFCQEHEYLFDGDWPRMLDESRLSSEKVLPIKERFGLECIIHYQDDIPEEKILDLPIFDQEQAVIVESRVIKPDRVTPELIVVGEQSPLWAGRFLKLKVDATRGKKEILFQVAEILDWVEGNKRLEKSQAGTRMPRALNEETLRIWDLAEEGKSGKEIISEVWPEEHTRAFGMTEDKKDDLYDELQRKYQREGREDWDEVAFLEAYGDRDENDSLGEGPPNKLFQKIADVKRRMEREFKKF